MKRICSNARCHVDDGESCPLGHVDYSNQCPEYCSGQKPREPQAGSAKTQAVSASTHLPWSGSALGLDDLIHLLPRGRSIVIGVLGAHDAGKTTLLTGSYLQILQGQLIAGASFAGSRTLGAWEALAAWTRFSDATHPASFPPHTSRGTGRIPGLLHLALRGSGDEHRDILLTDAPGEWFSRWAIQEDTDGSEGARWIQARSDAFLVFADCKRLCGEARGEARKDTRELIERLGKHVGKRPTTLVWSKADHQPREGIRNAIRRALNENIPHANEIETSTNHPIQLLHALEQVLQPAWTPPRADPLAEPVVQRHPFGAFRGSYAHA